MDRRIVLQGDSGATPVIRPLPQLDRSGRPLLFVYGTRPAALFGPFDRVLTTRRLASVPAGGTAWLGPSVAQIGYDPAGNLDISINTGRMEGLRAAPAR